jgi:hypothetical protein
MNAYADPRPSSRIEVLTSEDISRIFKKGPAWFSRHSVRKRLYAKGFPKPFERGLWSPKAVADWIANPKPPAAKPRPKRRPNAYAEVAEHPR